MGTMFSPSTVTLLSSFIIFFCLPRKVFSFSSFSELQLPPNVTGPVSFAFDLLAGGLYTGVNDGRILKSGGTNGGFIDFGFTTPTRSKAVCDGTTNPDAGPTCGRPLGLGFDYKENLLYIADAYFGLLVVDSNGRLATQLATSAEGVPFSLLNGLDVDPFTGTVYFTDFSTTIQLRNLSSIIASSNTSEIFSDSTGRLLKYDTNTKNVTVLLSGLSGAAGTAISSDGMFILVAEFSAKRIQRFWLRGPKSFTSETFIVLPGRPINIKRTARGDFWVPVIVQSTKSSPTAMLTGRRLSYHGTILDTLTFDALYGESTLISEVQEHLGALYIGTTSTNFVGIYAA